MPGQLTLRQLGGDPRLREVLVEHGRRNLRLQVGLRTFLILFAACTAVFLTPVHDREWLYVAVGCYALLGSAANVWLLAGREAAVRLGWLALLGDVLALVLLTLIANESAEQSWTADLIITGFFLVPFLGAAQLRPGACLAVVVPTDLAYLGASLATRIANGDEPLASVLLRSAVLSALSAGCVGLTFIQRSRVLTIGSLVNSRAHLLGEILEIEGRERKRLSEQLHDGALQYVLAARMDLDDVRDASDPQAVDRIDAALGQASTLLRSTVGELYPAVLQQAGLPEALRQVAHSAAARGGFAISIEDADWPAGMHTTADPLLFTTARELLGNVTKHAQAREVSISISLAAGQARLAVGDDGLGIPDGELDRKLRDGHIGIASHRTRIDAAGGTLALDTAPRRGTVVTVCIPAEPVGDPAAS